VLLQARERVRVLRFNGLKRALIYAAPFFYAFSASFLISGEMLATKAAQQPSSACASVRKVAKGLFSRLQRTWPVDGTPLRGEARLRTLAPLVPTVAADGNADERQQYNGARLRGG
jgi:hypothetical protein